MAIFPFCASFLFFPCVQAVAVSTLRREFLPTKAVLHLFTVFAIVSIAGFQEKVQKGMKLKVPSLSEKEGASVKFDTVHLVVDGKDIQLGMPLLKGATVEAKVISHGRGDTIRVFKMRRRKRYRRTQGHRQGYSMIEVTGISLGNK